ncbi:MAG TPA: hypothetical protein VLW45_01445 [Pelomicrobium sp.]|nr:hypothetical protein [Pelomicrobium sp.]
MIRLTRFVMGCAVLAAAMPAAATPECTVPVALWDRPRSGAAILATKELRPCVLALDGNPGARLAIRHAAAVESALQAEELRSWLAALAVDPERIELVPGLGPRDPLRLEVRTGP